MLASFWERWYWASFLITNMLSVLPNSFQIYIYIYIYILYIYIYIYIYIYNLLLAVFLKNLSLVISVNRCNSLPSFVTTDCYSYVWFYVKIYFSLSCNITLQCLFSSIYWKFFLTTIPHICTSLYLCNLSEQQRTTHWLNQLVRLQYWSSSECGITPYIAIALRSILIQSDNIC